MQVEQTYGASRHFQYSQPVAEGEAQLSSRPLERQQRQARKALHLNETTRWRQREDPDPHRPWPSHVQLLPAVDPPFASSDTSQDQHFRPLPELIVEQEVLSEASQSSVLLQTRSEAAEAPIDSLPGPPQF